MFNKRSVFILLIIVAGLLLLPFSSWAAVVHIRYYESLDVILRENRFQIYSFAPLEGEYVTIVAYGINEENPVIPALTMLGPDNVTLAEDLNLDGDSVAYLQVPVGVNGMHNFIVARLTDQEGLVRVMLFEGDPIDYDITILDYADPIEPSRGFLIGGDPENPIEVTTEVIDPEDPNQPDPFFFSSRGTNTQLPPQEERFNPVQVKSWLNQDTHPFYTINIRPIPELDETFSMDKGSTSARQVTNAFDYLLIIGKGSEPVRLNRDICRGVVPRVVRVYGGPNTTYNSNGELPAGTEVEIVGENGDWLQVVDDQQPTGAGWVFNDNILADNDPRCLRVEPIGAPSQNPYQSDDVTFWQWADDYPDLFFTFYFDIDQILELIEGYLEEEGDDFFDDPIFDGFFDIFLDGGGGGFIPPNFPFIPLPNEPIGLPNLPIVTPSGGGDDGGDGAGVVVVVPTCVTVNGTAGIDNLNFGRPTSTQDECVYGLAGNDQLDGFGGNDLLDGGFGNDILYTSQGNDTLDGGSGNDTYHAEFSPGNVFASLYTNSANAYGGNQILLNLENLLMGAGNDTLTGNSGDNSLAGGGGTDLLDESPHNSAMTINLDGIQTATGAGNDSLSSIENARTGGGNDSITLNHAGDNSVHTGSGDDTVVMLGTTGSGITHTIVTDSGNDLIDLDANGAAANIFLGVGSDTVRFADGVTGDFTLTSGGGNDILDFSLFSSTSIIIDLANIGLLPANRQSVSTNLFITLTDKFFGVFGGGEADTIRGNDLGNYLVGNGDNDEIHGREGNDTLEGGTAGDQLYGGTGSDSIVGGADAADELFGGSHNTAGPCVDDVGSDTLVVDSVTDTAYGGNFNDGGCGADGNDSVTITSSNSTAYGGNKNIAGGTGNDGNDTITASGSNNTIYGGNFNRGTGIGSDGGEVITLVVGGGANTVFGGNNNQNGGVGDDTADNISDQNGGNDSILGGNDNSGGPPGTGNDSGVDTITSVDGGTDTIFGDNAVTGGTDVADDLTNVDGGDNANQGNSP